MLLSLRKNGLTSLNKEVRVFKETVWASSFGLIERGVPHRGVPQKCVRGRASGAIVRLGHVLRGFIYSTIETRHFDTYPNRF